MGQTGVAVTDAWHRHWRRLVFVGGADDCGYR